MTIGPVFAMMHEAESLKVEVEAVLKLAEEEWIKRLNPVEYVECKTCGCGVDGVSVKEACLRVGWRVVDGGWVCQRCRLKEGLADLAKREANR